MRLQCSGPSTKESSIELLSHRRDKETHQTGTEKRSARRECPRQLHQVSGGRRTEARYGSRKRRDKELRTLPRR